MVVDSEEVDVVEVVKIWVGKPIEILIPITHGDSLQDTLINAAKRAKTLRSSMIGLLKSDFHKCDPGISRFTTDFFLWKGTSSSNGGDKLSYTRYLFERTGKDLDTAKQTIHCMEERIKKWYPDLAAKQLQVEDVTSSTNLVEMMLIDGCFIIELVYRYHRKEQDPILNNPFMYSAVRCDSLILENQIPFFVLEKLFNLTLKPMLHIDSSYSNPTLSGCLLSFFGDIMGLEDSGHAIIDDTCHDDWMYWLSPYHILHLLHYFYLPNPVPDEVGAYGMPELRTAATRQ